MVFLHNESVCLGYFVDADVLNIKSYPSFELYVSLYTNHGSYIYGSSNILYSCKERKVFDDFYICQS